MSESDRIIQDLTKRLETAEYNAQCYEMCYKNCNIECERFQNVCRDLTEKLEAREFEIRTLHDRIATLESAFWSHDELLRDLEKENTLLKSFREKENQVK